MKTDWTARFIVLAQHVASWSKDTTKVGAVLVGPDREVRLTAFNGPPKGVLDTQDRFIRPEKYLFASHAEANLIAFAAREGIRTAGCTAYVTHHPCAACARTLIQAGVSRVVAAKGSFTQNAEWENDIRAARAMFEESGVAFEERF